MSLSLAATLVVEGEGGLACKPDGHIITVSSLLSAICYLLLYPLLYQSEGSPGFYVSPDSGVTGLNPITTYKLHKRGE